MRIRFKTIYSGYAANLIFGQLYFDWKKHMTETERNTDARSAVFGVAETELKRDLNLRDCISLVVGAVIGSGIFLVPQSIAQRLPESGLIFGVWIFASLFAFFGGLSYAELGASMPNTGGAYIHIREAYGRRWGFLYGWIVFWVINAGSTATLATAFGIYSGYFLPLGYAGQKFFALAAIAILAFINYRGVRSGAIAQNLTTVFKVGGLVFLIVGGLLLASKNYGNFRPVFPEEFSWDTLSAFGLAMVGTLWAFEGWHQMPMNGGEIRNPRRNIPLGMFAGLLILAGIYLLANITYITQLSIGEMAASPFVAADAARRIAGEGGAVFLAIVILISVFGAANANLMAPTRIFFSMAKDGLFFKKAVSVHPVYRSPSFAILIQAVWAGILVLIVGTFEDLFTFTISASAIFYGLTVSAVFVMRKKYPDIERPYKVWGYPVTPALFIAVVIAFVSNTTVNTLKTEPQNVGIFVLVVITGLAFYQYWSRR